WAWYGAKWRSGRSTLITRAPASASRQVHMGAATACSSDTTNRPDRGRGMGVRFRRVGNGGFAVAHAYPCRPPRGRGGGHYRFLLREYGLPPSSCVGAKTRLGG